MFNGDAKVNKYGEWESILHNILGNYVKDHNWGVGHTSKNQIIKSGAPINFACIEFKATIQQYRQVMSELSKLRVYVEYESAYGDKYKYDGDLFNPDLGKRHYPEIPNDASPDEST